MTGCFLVGLWIAWLVWVSRLRLEMTGCFGWFVGSLGFVGLSAAPRNDRSFFGWFVGSLAAPRNDTRNDNSYDIKVKEKTVAIQIFPKTDLHFFERRNTFSSSVSISPPIAGIVNARICILWR